jgi:hypothetical protein
MAEFREVSAVTTMDRSWPVLVPQSSKMATAPTYSISASQVLLPL